MTAYPRLAGDLSQTDSVMRYELAQRVARLIDQYLGHHPGWMTA